MSNASASNSTADKGRGPETAAPAPQAADDKPRLPQLSALEDDDEFEEFAAEDWKDEETVAAEQAKGLNEQLWEDNWDDDDVEDDFGKQLRAALTNPNPSGPQRMQT